jgi:hypothetical protein
VGYEMAFRPGGVTALAVIFIIFAALGVVGAIFIETVFIPQLQTSNNFNIVSSLTAIYYFTANLPWDQAQLIVTSIVFQYFFLSNGMTITGYIQLLQIGALIGIAIVPLLIIASIGLLRMKQWGRYLGMIVGILSIIGSIASIIIAVTLGGIAVILVDFGIYTVPIGIIIVVYLYSVVKEDFEMR